MGFQFALTVPTPWRDRRVRCGPLQHRRHLKLSNPLTHSKRCLSCERPEWKGPRKHLPDQVAQKRRWGGAQEYTGIGVFKRKSAIFRRNFAWNFALGYFRLVNGVDRFLITCLK
ncbi:unnamed protein product [Tuber aestivum]|uniref:Uncharacterized protein n=1 Tax=Tuber aestivum TaxID=59557 RepID=A0A292PSC7_9PEZI|nr:unnamed protein product [Tuber aestivum]